GKAQEEKDQRHAYAHRYLNVRHAVKAPAEAANQVHNGVEKRDLLPNWRQHRYGVKTAAQKGKRRNDHGGDDLQFFEAIGPYADGKPKKTEGNRGKDEKTHHPEWVYDVERHKEPGRHQNDRS